MFRKLTLALGLASSACAPAVDMPATQASEVLERFAAGAEAGDICTPEGRALLRSAVRAYGEEMASAGVPWPTAPGWGGEASQLNSVDASVLTAFAGGFVEASDFRGPARRLVQRLSLVEQWPQLHGMRRAARVACEEVAELQHAAARFVLETDRYRLLAQSAVKQESASTQADRQARRLARAQAAMQSAAYRVEWRVEAAAS